MHTQKKTFSVCGRTASLYAAEQSNLPMIVLNTYTDHGDAVVRLLQEMHCPDCHLLVICNLNWNHDMTPWECPPLNKKDAPLSGGAADYLKLLCTDIIPQACSMTAGKPSCLGIAGYSLAGLFALYALYHCDLFSLAGSMSGSLWYPHFTEYVLNHTMQKTPQKLYLSLGDREADTKHPLLKTVRQNTETAAAHFRAAGIRTALELNPGNHFQDAEQRTAKGILALLASSCERECTQ